VAPFSSNPSDQNTSEHDNVQSAEICCLTNWSDLMDKFLEGLKLDQETLEDTKAILESEAISLNHLLTKAADFDLEEIGISEKARRAIEIEKAHRYKIQVCIPSRFIDALK
jgi:hypothetical protein